MVTRPQIHNICIAIQQEGINFVDFIVSLLESHDITNSFTKALSPIYTQLCHPKSLNKIISAFLANKDTSGAIRYIARNLVTHELVHEVGDVVDRSQGFHLNASHLTVETVLQFSRFKMAEDLMQKCPQLWRILRLLLNATSARAAVRRLEDCNNYLTELRCNPAPKDSKDKDNLPQTQAALGSVIHLGVWELNHSMLPGRRGSSNKARERQVELAEVRCVSLFGILMQSTNVNCNALQTMLSLFVHAANTPERVVELLAHASLAISPSSIIKMIDSLSEDAAKTLKKQLPTLMSAIAYDNLNIYFKTEQPTIDYSGNLAHITTGTFFPLQSADPSDLRVSDIIWKRSPINPTRNPLEPVYEPDHDNLMSLLRSANEQLDDDPLSTESRMAWHVRDILLQKDVSSIAPALKDKYRLLLGLPAAKNSAPVTKTKQFPARATHISVSTNSGNAVALDNLLEQGGAKDSMLEDHVVIVHGDLGTGEHIHNLKSSRRIEETPRNRLQHVQYVPGFLHLEMAITDALWRLYLDNQHPSSGKSMSKDSIFHLCSLARPRDSKKLATGPDHQMRDHTTRYALAALIADAWRTEVESQHQVAIDKWLPTWDDIISMSRKIVRTYIAGTSFVPSSARVSDEADMANDNVKLFARDTMLWTMVRHASRHGDVGCIEELLPFWICIWKHTGKHKYAEHITQFLLNLKHVWPERFANVVRMNWFVNPTGTTNGFRPADWVVERNNLMHKVVHGGEGVTRTLDNIIKESPLTLVFQRAYEIIEENFHITKSTLRHTKPSMGNTLAYLQQHVRERRLHSHIHGRTLYSAPVNSVAAGLLLGTDRVEKLAGELLDEGEGEDSSGSDGTSVATASEVDGDE